MNFRHFRCHSSVSNNYQLVPSASSIFEHRESLKVHIYIYYYGTTLDWREVKQIAM